MKIETLGEGNAVVYASCGGLWVMILHRPPTVDDMLAAAPTLRTMTELAPKGFGTLTWILPEAGFSMDGPARTAAADITRAHDKVILAQATVVEGQGFQVASVRMIIAGLDLLSRASAPTRVFARLDEAVAWVAPFSPGTPPAVADVVIALEGLRASFASAPRARA
jgi:hypothetical protein